MAMDCRHCEATGTCSNGAGGNSCDSCAQKARDSHFPFTRNKIVSTKGLPCGTCQGYGDVEVRVWNLQSTIGPILGLLLVGVVLLTIAGIAATSPAHHSQILTLLGTLAGSVVGFYFKGAHTLPKVPQTTRTPRLSPAASTTEPPSTAA
jgi:hypothetical protein